jgi:TPR repeat protein
MPRLALVFVLCLALRARAEDAVAASPEKDYRAKRQAALAAQWMETKLPWETPAAFLARMLDSARDDDSRATAAVGWEFHQRGDKERATFWLSRSAEHGNRFAAYLLGLLNPLSAPADASAVDWMQRAADAGLADAQFEIGVRDAQGKIAKLDLAAARDWYGRAAAQNYAPALCNLATLELQGSGGPANLEAATQHFRAAGDAGFPQGSFGLGEVLRVQNNFAAAAAAYRRAADAGIIEADFWLGCFASQGIGQARDETEAANRFFKAAAGGHAVSQAVSADLLARGVGVAADPDAASRWEVELQKITDRELCTSLGGVYLEGRLVPRDLVKALQYFRKAAAQGQPTAQRWAGAILASGEAGERNLLEAYQWLWLAARKGQPDAESAFQAVLQSMDGNQILEAARRAEQFQPTPPDGIPKN